MKLELYEVEIALLTIYTPPTKKKPFSKFLLGIVSAAVILSSKNCIRIQIL